MKKIVAILFIMFFLISSIHAQQKEGNASDRGRFYIIGTGPSGPQMATLQALDTIKRMDAIVASDEHIKLFEEYAENKPVLFDPWKGLYSYKGKYVRQLQQDEIVQFINERSRIINERVVEIKSILAEGKDIGLLESGNPFLFGPSNWYTEKFDPEELVIIPGMGSDAAAMAALGKSVLPAYDARLVIQSSPFYLMDHRMGGIKTLKDLSQYPSTLILYMALEMSERLFSLLSQTFPPETPCAVVYWAGYPEKQKIIRGTIADMGPKLAKEEEKYMGLLFIGRFIEGKPYEAAMSRPQLKKKQKLLKK